MSYDLVIKNGTVIDGSGLPRFRADVGVRHGRIATIGRIRERAREVVDADGQVVAPGFVDGHTHMDAQVFWDPLGTSSCWHGITSGRHGQLRLHAGAVRGEGQAPGRPQPPARRGHPAGRDGSGHQVERGRPIPEFLDALDRLPKGINYSGYVGHSALRTFAMGERAFERACDRGRPARRWSASCATRCAPAPWASPPRARRATRRPTAARWRAAWPSWDEVRRLVGVMGEMNAGVFELAGEGVDRDAGDPGVREWHTRLRDLAVESGRPITFGVFSRRDSPDTWRKYLALLDETAALGGACSPRSTAAR